MNFYKPDDDKPPSRFSRVLTWLAIAAGVAVALDQFRQLFFTP